MHPTFQELWKEQAALSPWNLPVCCGLGWRASILVVTSASNVYLPLSKQPQPGKKSPIVPRQREAGNWPAHLTAEVGEGPVSRFLPPQVICLWLGLWNELWCAVVSVIRRHRGYSSREVHVGGPPVVKGV